MSRTKANAELDSLIEEITVDCYDEYEQLTAFQTAFENDANFHAPAASSASRSRFYPFTAKMTAMN